MIYGNSELNELFDTFFNNRGRNYNYTTTLVKNDSESELYEINHTKDGAYLFFDAPGFNKSNLKVEMEGGVLHIEGKRTYKLNNEEKKKTVSKQFKIGDDYDSSSIEATIEDGLLTVFVPNYKKQEKKRISLL
jgi:HSP20 family molecular chaperone IbpA